jgi:hypothetical protein
MDVSWRMSHAPGDGFWCRCSACKKKGRTKWMSLSSLRRHAQKDLQLLLNAQAEDGPANGPEDVVDNEREGAIVDDLPNIAQVYPASEVHEESDTDEDEDMPEPCSAQDIFEMPMFQQWQDVLDPDPDPDERKVLVGELLLTYFEWMCVHKPTNECSRAVHAMLSLLVPPHSTNLPEWAEVHSMLDTVYKNVVVEVDLCPNDHIAFVDATHPKLVAAGHMHAHRTFCPHPGCGAARYKPDDGSGRKVAVKKGYYFPIDAFVSSIFRDGHTEEHRKHTTGEFPPGHVRRSRGYHEKVTGNPHMNTEPRNQAFVGMADGIPLFRSRKTSLGVVVGAFGRQTNQTTYPKCLVKYTYPSFTHASTG